MVINNHDQSRVWVLRLMKDGKIRKRQDIYQDVIELAEISDDEINKTISSGQSRVLNSLSWAISSFVKAGILNRLSRSTYQITDIGLEMAEKWKYRTEISQREFAGLPIWASYQKSILERKQSQFNDISQYFDGDKNQEAENIDFENQAKNAIKEIETEIAVELLNKLQQDTPLFFEKAVLKLLLAMGYGGKENLFEHTGKSHDGGIDGVIKQDPLGIQKIYIQAKRYADNNKVGRPELQQFVGVLSAQRNANAGVFITTSSFHKNAIDWLREIPSNLNVLLIDGQELATLMIRYKVGIQVKELLEICEIDEDFFE